MEFKLINPKSDSGFVKAIDFNFEELEKELKSNLEKYQNLVYTDDTIPEAKKDRASLNKFKNFIEDERKRIKNLCLAPYNDFEKKIKILTGLIDEPIAAIDTQVGSYEARKKEAKRKDLENFFNDNAGDLKKLISYNQIANSKWLNATYSLKTAFDDITNMIDKINLDLKTITDLKSDWELTLVDTYLKSFDISEALREKTRLEEKRKLLEKIEKEKQVEAKIEEVTENIYIEDPDNEEITVTEKVAISKEETTTEKIYERKFWVKGTADQLRALGRYMKANGIEYGGIQ